MMQKTFSTKKVLNAFSSIVSSEPFFHTANFQTYFLQQLFLMLSVNLLSAIRLELMLSQSRNYIFAYFKREVAHFDVVSKLKLAERH